ncbi:hypothetical protein M011DRAFT_472999 [Sporormia fimetaria CBS 119925]|uniref:Uncharacterized protein n=1 Tax=Sporormia fimetaria CBS 119925 TaxID=1340428 RepID=A0A6A6VQY4_9PLEO|nr:hypothetical protein M011DRAFT_472999 [Sporormia fimetaria CBS 119925]
MDSSSAPQGAPRPPTIVRLPVNAFYAPFPPDEPPPPYDPPSYDDATRSSTAPLLVGPPLDYGTHRAYPDLETGSLGSSDIEESSRTLPEWVGQALVVFVFLAIIYGFWEFVHDTDLDDFPR